MNFKKFAIGSAIFILTIIFIVFVNKAVNQEPKADNCFAIDSQYSASDQFASYNNYASDQCFKEYNAKVDKYEEKGFITVLLLSLLAMVAGVLVKSVAPISWGLLLAGLSMIIYVFGANFDAIGKPYRAIVTGISLVVLIWLSYAKLGDKEMIERQISTKKTPPPTSPTSSTP